MPATYKLPLLSAIVLPLLSSCILLTSCKKNIQFNAAAPADYFMPLQVGKFAIYRLDSLNFYYYGQLDTITRYLAKDMVETATTDNQGRPSWIVVRYLNDTAGRGPWIPSTTFLVTPTASTLEVVENNWRFSKLAYPVKEGFSWTGNSYLPYAPFRNYFKFSDGGHLSIQDWNYTYQQVNKPWQSTNKLYDSTTTIIQVNTSVNAPITAPLSFASRSYWAEIYAKNIGLVYRRTELWEYQPPTPNGTQSAYRIGFELTLRIVDHN